MKLAIMQPYVFPYIGYFQLINAVDKFVFYDDVNFIKKGYINRNALLINDQKHVFTIPCKNISQNKRINEIALSFDTKAKTIFLRTIEFAYKKAPFYEAFFSLMKNFIEEDRSITIADLSISSVKFIASYLDIDTKWAISSTEHFDSMGQEKETRLMTISNKENATVYINPIGGTELYSKDRFIQHGLLLNFIESTPISYKQYKNDFIPNLSIIDVIMFNDKSTIRQFLNSYKLI